MKQIEKQQVAILLTSVFIIAACGILYELLISTITSYFQGSSILHFSIVIGLFLSFMGVGSYLSKFIQKNLMSWFVGFEIGLSVVGGFSAFLLYFAFSLTEYFYGFAFVLIALLGTFIGIEIPILTRIIRRYDTLKDALANVLSFDYLGSLLASVAFPLLLLPLLGTMRTAFIIGGLNLAVAIFNTWFFRAWIKKFKTFLMVEGVILLFLISGMIYSFQIVGFFEKFLYRDHVILSKQSSYQQLVVTKWNQDIRLYINGNLQFSSRDEYRYHESLVHIPLGLSLHKERVLVLGGGDGLVARELLKYDDIQEIEVVDLDPAITDLAKSHPIFKRLNQNALNDPRVKVINTDAYKYIEKSSDLYDIVIIDLPDPNDPSLGKLYSQEFYGLLQKRTANGGVIVTQSASPYFAPNAFWCIHNTLKSVYPTTLAYHAYIPTFGQWGFNVAINGDGKIRPNAPETATEQATTQLKEFLDSTTLDLQYLQPEMIESLFQFGKDTEFRETDINTLEDQPLIYYYEKGWDNWR